MIQESLIQLSAYITSIAGTAAARAAILVAVAIAAVAGYWLTRAVLWVIEAFVSRSHTTWDDDLLNPRMMRAVSQLTPAIVVWWLLPAAYAGGTDATLRAVDIGTRFYILWAAIRMVNIFVGNLHDALARRRELRVYAVKGIFQMVKLIFIGIGIIVGISILIGKSPVVILTALGASAAVLMLVFKDTILGLVASVQLTSNRMLHRGDWVVVDSHGANGEVEDISLTTVKVRNWDNSITTIPPYSLISESFRNYQPMRDSGGRRVDRAVLIDVNSIRFCTPAELQTLAEQGFLEQDDAAGNDHHVVNLQLLSAYLDRYIARHPLVNPDMLHMVRQMEPTDAGIPLQLYFFTRTVQWKQFEHDKDVILNHVYAVVQQFGLRIFQAPAGSDFKHR